MRRRSRQRDRIGQPMEPGGAEPPTRPRPARTAIVVGLLAVVTVGAVIVGALGLGGRHQPVAQTRITMRTVVVDRCTLTDRQTFPAQTTFGRATPMPLQTEGLITWLPDTGTVAREGDALLRVDDRPVVLLHGSLPQYRTLRPPQVHTITTPVTSTTTRKPESTATSKTESGETTTEATKTKTTVGPAMHGADVLELAQALARLGFGSAASGMQYTRPAVETVRAWQRSLGLSPTGVVALGDVYYAHGPVRVVHGSGGKVGQSMSGAALASTSRRRTITATVPDTSTWAMRGATLSVDTGGRAVKAVVTSVDPAESTSPDGGRDLDIVARVSDQAALADAGLAVTATHVNSRRTNVLCVPSPTLVALAEGGYGLQAADGSYRAVRTGLFADGKVEVSGKNVTAGLDVLMPADS